MVFDQSRRRFTASKIQYLTAREYKAFGFSKTAGDAFVRWIFDRTGFVLGSDGSGGSGVFVETRDGVLGLLTARHVALRAVMSGRISVAKNIDGEAWSLPPKDIWVSANSDTAFLVVADGLPVPAHLSPEEWDPRAGIEPDEGMRAVAIGVPGVWKRQLNLAARVIKGMKEFAIWTELGGSRIRDGLIESKADTRIEGMPVHLKGMSGGPLFTTNRLLLGIHKGQNEARTILFSTPRGRWMDLFVDLRDEEIPLDLSDEPARYFYTRSGDSAPAYEFNGRFYWSRSGSGGKHSGFGQINSIEILAPNAWRVRPILVDSRFYFSSVCGEDERKELFADEARSLIDELFVRPSAEPE